jgi:hypothetical protein
VLAPLQPHLVDLAVRLQEELRRARELDEVVVERGRQLALVGEHIRRRAADGHHVRLRHADELHHVADEPRHVRAR